MARSTAAKAGPDHRRCTAKSKSTQERCGRYAIPGGTVCATHGGNSPVVREAGARRQHAVQIQQDAAATLAHLGIQPLDNPLDELGKLTAEARALTTALGARVNALNDLADYDDKRAPHIRVEIEMYERALDRTHRMLDSLVKHGYMERQIKIAEGEAAIVSGIIRRVIAGLGLTPEQQKMAMNQLAEEFRAIDTIL